MRQGIHIESIRRVFHSMKELTRIALAALCILSASCGKKQMETTYEKQESNIQAIVSSLTKDNSDATTEYLNGSVRVTLTHGEGEGLREDGAVSFYYAGFYISSTKIGNNTLFATNYDTFASSARWSVTDSSAFDIKTVNLAKDDIVEGLRNGLVGVKAGDECYVLFSGKHGFGKKKIANVPARAALAYRLWIKSVTND